MEKFKKQYKENSLLAYVFSIGNNLPIYSTHWDQKQQQIKKNEKKKNQNQK